MKILSIDPGVVNFGYLIFDTEKRSVDFKSFNLKENVLGNLTKILERVDVKLVICERQLSKSKILKRIEYHCESFFIIRGIDFRLVSPCEKTFQFNGGRKIEKYKDRKKFCIEKAFEFLKNLNYDEGLNNLRKKDELGDCLCQFMAWLKINFNNYFVKLTCEL